MLRWTRRVLAGIAVLLLLLLAGVLALTWTDYGRERVRRIALGQLAGIVHGHVEIERIRGNLLTGATLEGVVITDSVSAPFLRAERIVVDYSIPGLLRSRIHLSELRVEDAVIDLDRPPGGDWNFARIFPSDTAAADTTRRGFGSWIRIENLTIENGLVRVRNEWLPDSTLRGAARDSAIRVALDPGNRLQVVQVESGYQSLHELRDLHAVLPLLRLADPDEPEMVAVVESLRTIALVTRPPAADLRDLSGRFVLGEDSIWFRDLKMDLPESHVEGDGSFAMETGEFRIEAVAAPLAFGDLHFAVPTLSDSGGISARIVAGRRGERIRVAASGIDLRMEGARLAGHTTIEVGDSMRLDDTDLAYTGVDTRILQGLAPDISLPIDGVIEGRLQLSGVPARLDVTGWTTVRERDGALSRIAVSGQVGNDDGLSARDLTISLEPVRLSLLHGVRPDLPLTGTLTGDAALTGSLASGFDVQADLRHQATGNDPSRLLVAGSIGMEDGFTTPGLRLDLAPLQVAVARAFAPDLPVGGTLRGNILLTGSSAERLSATMDLVHQDVTGASNLVGRATVRPATMDIDADLRLPRLALATAGQFAPSAGLHGVASGEVHAMGTPRNLRMEMDLAVEEGGSLRASGGIDLRGANPRYDLQAILGRFDPAAVSTHAPPALLSGTVRAAGSGFAPATAEATLEADLVDDLPRVGGLARVAAPGAEAGAPLAIAPAEDVAPAIDATPDGRAAPGVEAIVLRAGVANGLVSVEQATLRLASAEAEVTGSFGLVAEQSGTLRYRVAVDSLSDFAALLPQSAPTPADSLSAEPSATDTLVSGSPEVAATDLSDAVVETVTIAAVERDAGADVDVTPDVVSTTIATAAGSTIALAGSLVAEGMISGNLERFDLEGSAATTDLIYDGSSVESAALSYGWVSVPDSVAEMRLDVAAGGVRAAGFRLDSLRIDAGHQGSTREGAGVAHVAVFQDQASDYRLDAAYRLSLEEREVRLDGIAMRFDSVYWRSAAPAVARWSGDAIEVENLELLDGVGGRIFVNGRLPDEGRGNLRIDVERLRIAQIGALLQDTTDIHGLLTLHADIAGTRSAPSFAGQTEIRELSIGELPLPDVQAAFDYADAEFRGNASLTGSGLTIATVSAQLPVNLALAGYEGPRMLDGDIAVDIRADSLPLDVLPSFTDAVAEVEGILRGNLTLRGTFDAPEPEGLLTLDLGSLRLVEPGVRLTDVMGTLRVRGDSVVIDSLVARSGGTIQVAGAIGIEKPTEPAFDLALTARGARVLNNQLGTAVADADLTVEGPFEAVRIAGTAHIREGAFYIPESNPELIDLSDPGLENALARIEEEGTEVPEPNPLLANLGVNVTVQIARNTWVRNADANVEIYTAEGEPLTVELDNRRQALTLDGAIHVDRGEYSFSGRLFELTRGSITFLGGEEIDPLLQLTAVHEAPRPTGEPLTISIGIGGYMSRPTVTLSSNSQPPLPESDMLSYLAFGRSSTSLLRPGGSGLTSGGVSGIGAMATQQLAGVALGALVEDAVSSLERSAGRAGLDVIRISPADDLPEEAVFGGAFQNVLRGTEIEAGKYLSRRLFLSAQGRPTPEAWPGVAIEYRTPQGFILRSSWEPNFLPSEPTFATDKQIDAARVFGLFLNWRRRF